MHFMGQKFKSSLHQQTVDLKFNLLINANIQNRKPYDPKQKTSNSNQKLSDNSLIPLSRFSNIKEHTMQLNIESKLNELKKRSYSQKKLLTQTNLQDPKNSLNPKQNKRKRLLSASSHSNLKKPSLTNDLIVQKQKLTNKQSIQGKTLGMGSKSSLNLETANLTDSLIKLEPTAINFEQRKSNQKIKFTTPIQSERVIPFSLEPSADKLTLKAKLINLKQKKTQTEFNVVKQQSNPKIITHKQLMNELGNSLTLYIKNCLLIEQSLDYTQFLLIIEQKATYNFVYAQNLSFHLARIKRFAHKYNLTSSIQVKKIISFEKRKVISNWQILNMLQNWNHILNQSKKGSHFSIVGIKFYYPDSQKGVKMAANTIIKFFRSIKDRKQRKKMASLLSKVIKIQRIWRRLLIAKNFRQQMLQNAERKLQQCQKLQQKLIANYQIIKTSRKVQIHIGSLSFEQFKRITIENKSHFEMGQISRIFKALESPDTFIIYVTPFQLSEGVIKYYQRLFKIATGSDLVMKERVYFINPQNSERICHFAELSTLNYLLCSPKALKRIRTLIKSISSTSNSYIVPSYPSIEYTNLSYELKIPIFSSAMTLAKLYSTKIGYREIISPIIEKEKTNPPLMLLKSFSSIFSEKELINTLALLIYKNQHTKRWFFKIDDEFSSRGLAYFNVNSINLLKKLNNENNDDVLSDMFGTQKEVIQLIADQLKEKLKTKLKILHKAIYPTYNQFMTHFLTRGGVIEAAPSLSQSDIKEASVSFLIEPNGDFEILGTFNKVELNSKSICGTAEYPAKKCQQIDIEKIIRHLYRRIYLKMKLFGYFTIDLLVSSQKELKDVPYVIGLSCFLTFQTCGLFLIKQLAKVRYDKDSNTLIKLQNLTNQSEITSLQSSKISKIQFENQQTSNNQIDAKSQISTKNKASNNQTPQINKVTFLYCPKIVLPDLQPMAEFFRKCKFENIAFDLKTLLGTLFVPLDELQCESIGLMVCQKKQLSMNFQLLKVVEFLSKNYRNNHQNKGKEKKSFAKWQNDEVGMLRGALMAEIHKSEEHKKAEKQGWSHKNCEATFNNLQSF